MINFKKFLLENSDFYGKIKELDDAISYPVMNEKFASVNDDGDVVIDDIEDENFYTVDNFDAIVDNDIVSENYVGGDRTWGGEYIIDLNLDDTKEKINEIDSSDSRYKNATNTEKHLIDQKSRSLDQVKNDGQQYMLHKKDDGSYEITKKKYNEKERHPLTKDDIEQLIIQTDVSKRKPKEVKYEFDSDNNLLKNGKKIPKNRKKKFIQQLNKAAEKNFGKGEVHYKWQLEGEGWTDKLLVNTTKWDDNDELDTYRFDKAEYKVVDSDDEKSKIIGLLTKVVKAVNRPQKKIGYDFQKKVFTQNGIPMTDEQLKKFVRLLNGGIKDSNDSNYWEHFKISIKGSKVGDIANFSLPPIETCNKDSPCITDGCYAVKAYGMYPASRVAMDINLALLRAGRFDQFRQELNAVLKRVYKKTVGAMKKGEKINYFRFHVSGDAFSAEYFRAMCKVAEDNPDIGFWTYTKQYAILNECKNNIPENMSVLVSCWGDFRPKLWANGKYADLEKDFPLAYLDDGSENTEKYIDTKDGKGEPFVCPCTDYSETEVHCNKCLKCYKTKDIIVSNLIFKKH